MAQSKKWSLNKEDIKRQLESALKWLAPMVLVYLGQVAVLLKQKGLLGGADFVPDAQTVGAIQLYLINQLYGLFNRLKAGK